MKRTAVSCLSCWLTISPCIRQRQRLRMEVEGFTTGDVKEL